MRIERFKPGEVVPELLMLFWISDFMGADDSIKSISNSGLFHFERNGFRVSIGCHNDPMSTLVESRQEFFCARPHSDEVPHFFF